MRMGLAMRLTAILMPGAIGVPTAARAEMVPHTKRWDVELQSLPREQTLTKLDLTEPGLAAAKAACLLRRPL